MMEELLLKYDILNNEINMYQILLNMEFDTSSYLANYFKNKIILIKKVKNEVLKCFNKLPAELNNILYMKYILKYSVNKIVIKTFYCARTISSKIKKVR